MISKKFFLAAMLFLTLNYSALAVTTEGQAMDYKPFPYMFVNLQGGMQTTLTNYSQADLITGTASVSFGAMFTRAIGARLHVNGAWNKGGVAHPERDFRYDYNYITTDIDAMLNILGFIPSMKQSPLGVFLIGGVGLNTAWKNGDAATVNSIVGSNLLTGVWDGTRLSHNLRVGCMVEYSINRFISINAELDANSLPDRYNSKLSDSNDWQITAQVGVAFKFGNKKKPYSEPVVIATVEEFAEDRGADVVNDAPVVQPKKSEQTQKDIFFGLAQVDIDAAEMSKIAEIIAWMKSHPSAKASITGHADASTGTPEANAEYAKGRAENVAKAIIEGGIDASRLTVDSKGDTVMPYGDNEKSRVAIIIAEEQ